MSSRTGRGPVRSYRRRKTVLNIDLNHVPSADNREQEGPSTVLVPQQVQAIQQPQAVLEPPTQLGTGQVHAVQQPPAVQPPTIDVEAFDDDVIESSPRAFAEAKNKNNSRRNRRRTIVDVDLDDQTRVTDNNCNKRNRVSLGQSIINCDLYINLEGSSSLVRENMPPPEPPKEPVFNCPICIGPLVEEVSTKCGHIFCKACIKAAISAQNKCPTCRKKITVRSLIRVFLPSTS
ncbi:putative aminoacyltransferase, E1 ubiquitin-activating enzyme [Lupinus albus]|uniref:Putative aminoacyltransferase, E1 ubiquitin-activating enzyme n=1 Tax=Lupinus albus TaxID=3870 RepID=A0A6A4NRN1_LUPAL|nr:putative aminoacyltransferase, E1 ubiquitin-activating enzyme [Lupinus albus]